MPFRAVFVCGATGTQGGALTRQLIPQGITVHALSRDPSSDKARALASLGVKLWQGDYENEEALRAALQGVEAIFLNVSPNLNVEGASQDQAKRIIRLSKEAGATHAVFASGAALQPMLEFLDKYTPGSLMCRLLREKLDVEDEIRNAGFATYTILRPGNFMTNFIRPLVRMYPGLAETGRWISAFRNDTVLAMVDRQTIGVFSAAALLDPERFNGKTVAIVDEFLTVQEVLDKLSKATGKSLSLSPIPDEDIEAQKLANPFIGGQLALKKMPDYVDMGEVKSWKLPLSTFDAFLEREEEAVEACYEQVPPSI